MRVFGLEHTWYLNTFVAFTPYVTLLSAVPLIFALLLRRWRAVTVALLTSLALITLFLPRAIGGPDPGHGPTLRVMSSNMKIGAADPAAIVALVRAHHIDLLAVEEFTPHADDRLAAAGLTTLLPFSGNDTDRRRDRLGDLFALPDHRHRIPAARGRVRAGVRHRVGARARCRCCSTPYTPGLRTCPSSNSRLGEEHRAAAARDPEGRGPAAGRRLQRHARPFPAAYAARHRVRRRRLATRRRPDHDVAVRRHGCFRASRSTISSPTRASARCRSARPSCRGTDHKAIYAVITLPSA